MLSNKATLVSDELQLRYRGLLNPSGTAADIICVHDVYHEKPKAHDL